MAKKRPKQPTKAIERPEEFPETPEATPPSIDVSEEEAAELEECEPCDGLRIEVAREKNEDDEWDYYWMMFSKNGRPIATGPKPVGRLSDVKNSIASIRETIPEAPLVRLY